MELSWDSAGLQGVGLRRGDCLLLVCTIRWGVRSEALSLQPALLRCCAVEQKNSLIGPLESPGQRYRQLKQEGRGLEERGKEGIYRLELSWDGARLQEGLWIEGK